MTLWRSVAVALTCAAGLTLGSCGSFSGYVADSWPHFAGGEPSDLPPRPGTPGYNQFIAHGQPQSTESPVAGAPLPAASAQPAAASAQPAATGATAAIAKQPPAATAQTPPAFAEPPPADDTKPDTELAPAVERPADDRSAVQGGLY
jgi:hypothetical protein